MSAVFGFQEFRIFGIPGCWSAVSAKKGEVIIYYIMKREGVYTYSNLKIEIAAESPGVEK